MRLFRNAVHEFVRPPLARTLTFDFRKANPTTLSTQTRRNNCPTPDTFQYQSYRVFPTCIRPIIEKNEENRKCSPSDVDYRDGIFVEKSSGFRTIRANRSVPYGDSNTSVAKHCTPRISKSATLHSETNCKRRRSLQDTSSDAESLKGLCSRRTSMVAIYRLRCRTRATIERVPRRNIADANTKTAARAFATVKLINAENQNLL